MAGALQRHPMPVPLHGDFDSLNETGLKLRLSIMSSILMGLFDSLLEYILKDSKSLFRGTTVILSRARTLRPWLGQVAIAHGLALRCDHCGAARQAGI
jgi:hypothetical protein